MRNIWTIAKREYKLYFGTPIAYIFAFIILIILGFLFYSGVDAAVFQQIAPGVDIVTGPFVTLLIFGTPAITMRLLAEEQRLGTIELLLTAPVRDFELVVGKWLGAFLFLISIVAVTWVFPIYLNWMTEPGIDQGPLVTAYLGIVFICAALVAIGVAVSAFFSNQIAAFFVTFGVILILWIIGLPVRTPETLGGTILSYLDFSGHFYQTFFLGIIDLTDMVYFLSITALALFIGTMAVEFRRWR
jgi:ABC-2 type transport system permease protein